LHADIWDLAFAPPAPQRDRAKRNSSARIGRCFESRVDSLLMTIGGAVVESFSFCKSTPVFLRTP